MFLITDFTWMPWMTSKVLINAAHTLCHTPLLFLHFQALFTFDWTTIRREACTGKTYSQFIEMDQNLDHTYSKKCKQYTNNKTTLRQCVIQYLRKIKVVHSLLKWMSWTKLHSFGKITILLQESHFRFSKTLCKADTSVYIPNQCNLSVDAGTLKKDL